MKLYGVKNDKTKGVFSVINLSKFVSMTVFENVDKFVLNIFLEDQTDYSMCFDTLQDAEHERFKIITEYLGFSKEYASKVCGNDFSEPAKEI